MKEGENHSVKNEPSESSIDIDAFFKPKDETPKKDPPTLLDDFFNSTAS